LQIHQHQFLCFQDQDSNYVPPKVNDSTKCYVIVICKCEFNIICICIVYLYAWCIWIDIRVSPFLGINALWDGDVKETKVQMPTAPYFGWTYPQFTKHEKQT
jgi:hypothetical protein